MKKLLLAAGDKELSAATLDFSCYLARLTRSKITGVFLETLPHKETLITTLREDSLHIQSMQVTEMEGNETVREKLDRRMARFKDSCAARDVIGIAHSDHLTPWKELLEETRFADALVMDQDFTLHEHILEPYPSHVAKKMLHEAGCPVIVAPFAFEQIDEIIFTYDGSNTSLLAIRQFMCLFPELRDTKATVLQIWLEEDDHPKEQHRLKEWLGDHFSQVESVILEGESDDRLLEYLLSHPRAFIVMGGFGRSRISRLIQPSASGAVVKFASSPLFIAHL